MRTTTKMALLLLLGLTIAAYPQSPPDSVNTKQSVKNEKTAEANQQPESKQPEKNAVSAEVPCEKCCDKELTRNQKQLVMMPVYFFIMLLLITIWAAKRAGYNFSQAFYCDDPEEVIQPAPTPTDPNATRKITLLDAQGLPVYFPSTSKLIAFVSSLTTLVVIVCFISYYAYCMMKCRTLPDFEELFQVMVGLGLGIVPYGIKQFATAAKS